MTKRVKLNVSVMPSTKARLITHCDALNITMGDAIDDALKNFFENKDREHSAPDLVLDRLNQLTLAIMQQSQTSGKIADKVMEFEDQLIQITQALTQLTKVVENK